MELLNDAEIENSSGSSSGSAKPKLKLNGKYGGQLSSIMAARVAALNSGYADDFEWSIYDRLDEKFRTSPVKQGVVFKTGMKLVNHHASCARCHYTLVIDTYGRGCTHNCHYCYSKEMLSRHQQWNAPQPFPIDLSAIRKVFHTVFETDRRSKWREVLEKRIPLRIGSMSDSFMPMEKHYGVSRELLKMLRHYRYPYIIFTRGVLIATDEYMDALDRELCAIQFSMSGDNEELTKLIEPGAPSPAARLRALELLSKNGFWTTARMHPFFPTFPDGYFSDRASVVARFGGERNIPRFGFSDIEGMESFLKRVKDAGVPTVLVGFAYLSEASIAQIARVTGVPIRSFYTPETLKIRGDKHYSQVETAEYYKRMSAIALKVGIRFSTCFIGNGLQDYYRFQSLWANKSDCCDARGNVPGIKSSSQEIPWTTRTRHAPCKEAAHAASALDRRLAATFSPTAALERSHSSSAPLPN